MKQYPQSADKIADSEEQSPFIMRPFTKPVEKEPETPKDAWFAVGGFMLCSSLMLLINKLAVKFFPVPSFVIFSQLFFAALVVWICGNVAKVIEVDSLFDWSKVKWFAAVGLTFVCLLFSNMKTLQYSNVETFIVFRASTPILVSVGDFAFLGRELPSMHSRLCLLGMIFGAVVYVYTDGNFKVEAYTWVVVWYFLFIFDQLFIKKVTSDVPVKSNWSRVLYTNALSAIPLLLVWPFQLYAFWNSQSIETTTQFSVYSVIFYVLSCILSVAISYFAFLARDRLSAASFTIVGNVCKILTISINYVMWDNHANSYGIIGLGICLVCGYLYKQAPMRNANTQT